MLRAREIYRAIAGVCNAVACVFPSLRQVVIADPLEFDTVHGPAGGLRPSLVLSGYEPLQHRIQVGLLLGADTIAAGFATLEGFEVHFVDKFVDGKLPRKIRLVAENEQRDTLQSWLFQQSMELLGGNRNGFFVRGINDVAGVRQSAFEASGTGSAYTIAFTLRQYRSHIERNRGWPPRSQLTIVSLRNRASRAPSGLGRAIRTGTYHFRVT